VQVEGVRRSKTFDSKAKARAWAAEIETELRDGVEGVSTTETLGGLFYRYAEEVSENKRGAHWEIVRLRAWQRLPIAKRKLMDLKRQHIELWIQERLKPTTKGVRPVQPSTVNRELNLWSHCFTMARRWGLMKHNPLEDIERPKNPPHRDRRITQEEIDCLLVVFGYHDSLAVITQRQRAAVAFLLALETGMRAGELCGLSPASIDEEARFAKLSATKNGDARSVPLSKEALRLLHKLRWVDGEPLLGMPSKELSRVFSRAVNDAGIDDLTFHDSRHEATTRLAGKLGVLELARMIGHRDIRQLMTYYNKSATDIAKKLD
jgi:integrase